MALPVEILSRKFVKPSSPTHPSLRRCKISFLDELAMSMNVPLILFYPMNSHVANDVRRLEKALEKTITRFYFLAGRYIRDIRAVDCSDQGVEFVQARVSSKLQRALDHDIELGCLSKFLPCELGAVDEITDPLLAVQVTKFECGGLALGICISHRIADTFTLAIFLKEWAAFAQHENHETFIPSFNSASFFPARGLPSLDIGMRRSINHKNFATKKLCFVEKQITNMRLKARVRGKIPSKIRLVTAVIWKALMDVDLAKHGYSRDSILMRVMDIRNLIANPLLNTSCGNFWAPYLTKCTSSNISMDYEGLLDLLNDSVKKTFKKHVDACSNSDQGQMIVVNSFSNVSKIPDTTSVFALVSWCGLPFYEADFGYGKPVWASCGSMPIKNWVVLMDDADAKGVEAYVHLEANDMPYFEQDQNIKAYTKMSYCNL